MPFVGEIALFAFGDVPANWLPCQGQLLPIAQNQPLFTVLGTTFGGNGTTTFALPDLRGRAPVASGQGDGLQNYNLGQTGGNETHALTTPEMPGHSHTIAVDSLGSSSGIPGPDFVLGQSAGTTSSGASFSASIYGPDALDTGMMPPSDTGQGQGHENRMPSLALNFCIPTAGEFPCPPSA